MRHLYPVGEGENWLQLPNNQAAWSTIKWLIKNKARMAVWDGQDWMELHGTPRQLKREVAKGGAVAFIPIEIQTILGADPSHLAATLSRDTGI